MTCADDAGIVEEVIKLSVVCSLLVDCDVDTLFEVVNRTFSVVDELSDGVDVCPLTLGPCVVVSVDIMPLVVVAVLNTTLPMLV